MIIYKNNLDYIAVIIKYIGFSLIFNIKDIVDISSIILLYGTAFRQPLIKLYKHTVPQLLL